MNKPSQDKLGTMPIKKLLIVMSVPMMISMFVQALYNLVDSMFVAMLSETALTAVTLAYPIQNIMTAIGVGSGVGVNALVSRCLGQGDLKRAEKAANEQIFLSACYTLIFIILGIFLPRVYYQAQTDSAEIVEYGVQYLTVICLVPVGCFYGQNLEKLLIATGSSALSMISQATGAVINIIFDPLLIFGIGPFPAMGVTGAAAATVFGQIVAALVALYFNHRCNQATRFHLRQMAPTVEIVKAIYAVGIPSMITIGLGSAMAYFLNNIMLVFSTTAAAVFGIWQKLQSFGFMPVFGLNNGMIAIFAYNHGAGNDQRVRKTLRLGLIVGIGLTAVVAVCYELLTRQLLGLFSASEFMLSIGMPALHICCISLPLGACCLVLSSACQSLNHSMYTLIINLCRNFAIPVLSAFLLAQTGVLTMVWFSPVIAEVLSMLLAIFLARRVMKELGRV